MLGACLKALHSLVVVLVRTAVVLIRVSERSVAACKLNYLSGSEWLAIKIELKPHRRTAPVRERICLGCRACTPIYPHLRHISLWGLFDTTD
jgi:NAD-dependent dihydropyrimidine dehydrogenase PreA subunit